jgi:hypothetical protein
MTATQPDSEFIEWVRQSREGQGLPLKVTDPETLRELAEIILADGPRDPE